MADANEHTQSRLRNKAAKDLSHAASSSTRSRLPTRIVTGMVTASRPALTSSIMPRSVQLRFASGGAAQRVLDHLLAQFIRQWRPCQDLERLSMPSREA